MKNKALAILIVLLVLLGVYLVFFTGCNEEAIQITAKLRPARRGAPVERGTTPLYDVAFGFNKRYRLTSVKVVAAQDLATNKYPLALWHLVADSNTVPVRAITYGRPVRGMRPAMSGIEAEPLDPNTEYVLLVEAGDVRSRTNFFARERPAAR